MDDLSSGSAVFRIRLTTLAGISSTISAASSAYNSSRISFSSLSEKPRISNSCASGSISTKVSAACSLVSSRNISGICLSSRSTNRPATSLGFMVTRMSRSVAYFLSSSIFTSAFWTISKRSAITSSFSYCSRFGSNHTAVSSVRGIPQKAPADNFDRVYCHYCRIPWYILLF